MAKCETQRQLSDAGRAELKTAGEQFRLAGIPQDKAYSSRYCSAIKSAASFVDAAMATETLSGEGNVGKDSAQKARTLAFLLQRPTPGANIFMMPMVASSGRPPASRCKKRVGPHRAVARVLIRDQ